MSLNHDTTLSDWIFLSPLWSHSRFQPPTSQKKSLCGQSESEAGTSSLNHPTTIWSLVAFPSSNTHTANSIPCDHLFLFNWPNLHYNFGHYNYNYLLDIVISGQKFTGHFQIFCFLEDFTGVNVPLWVPTYFSPVSSHEYLYSKTSTRIQLNNESRANLHAIPSYRNNASLQKLGGRKETLSFSVQTQTSEALRAENIYMLYRVRFIYIRLSQTKAEQFAYSYERRYFIVCFSLFLHFNFS